MVLVQEAVRDLPGAGQAWVVLTACIVDQLRAGFDQAKEPFSKHSVGAPPACPLFHHDNLDWQHQQSFGSAGARKSLIPDDFYLIDENAHEHTYVNFPSEEV